MFAFSILSHSSYAEGKSILDIFGIKIKYQYIKKKSILCKKYI